MGMGNRIVDAISPEMLEKLSKIAKNNETGSYDYDPDHPFNRLFDIQEHREGLKELSEEKKES